MMGTEEQANYAAYVLGSLYLELNFDDAPYQNLDEAFLLHHIKPAKRREHDALAKKTNLYPIYKVLVTPTLQYFEPAVYEEGNLMLREHADTLFHSMRVAVMDENLETPFLREEDMKWLDCVINLISENGGIKLGNRRLNFMGYSNSQLKTKSFWFLCENDPIVIQQERGGYRTIGSKRIQRMGQFDKERNALKKFARIGQFFSAS